MDTLNWNLLSDIVDNKGRVPYNQNQHLFTKIAFDVFQLNSSPIESLWIMQEDDNGESYLAAMYDEKEQQIEAKSGWSALADKEAQNITLLYKDIPIHRFASKDYKFNSEDANIFQNILISKISSDKEFLKKFLNSQPKEKQKQILSQFPELA